MEPVTLTGGQVLLVHHESLCRMGFCSVHRPSVHPLASAPLYWRSDRRIMERVCEHGIGHPDPDDLKVRTWPSEAVHGCDGCCQGGQSE